jgi:hypothetical protein
LLLLYLQLLLGFGHASLGIANPLLLELLHVLLDLVKLYISLAHLVGSTIFKL